MKNIVLFGPPGSGKGTQSQLIVEKYKLQHTSTGDMLRAEITQQSDLGEQAQSFMKKGELVPDTLVIAMLRKFMNKHLSSVNGFLFDGFPRTMNQAQVLDELLREMATPIAVVIFLQTDNQELVRRIIQRGKESGARVDDNNPAVIENRLQVYSEQTLPLKTYYEQKKLLHEVDGMKSVDEVFASISKILDTITH